MLLCEARKSQAGVCSALGGAVCSGEGSDTELVNELLNISTLHEVVDMP